jgi:hypothetical protein
MSDAPVPATATRCLNCGAELSGPWCAACGQRDDREVHTLGHFAHQAFEGLTHADSRLWRTLWPLLVKPGFLTREFFRGRRQRYLPPFRLYLVISLLFFVVLSLLPGDGVVQVGGVTTGNPAELAEQRARADAELARLAAEEAAATDPTKKAAIAIARRGAEVVRDEVMKSLPPANESREARAKRVCNLSYEGPFDAWLTPRLNAGCRKSVIDEGSLGDALLRNFPRALFVLLPAMALLMMLLYWRPRRYYVEHLLLLVHNHAFIFLLLLVQLPVEALVSDTWAEGPVIFALIAYIAWYVYRSMRVYYGQSGRRTFAKFAALGFAFVIASSLVMVVTLAYSVATL